MSVDKVIDYVMRSPENTNPAVLKSLIETECAGASAQTVEFRFNSDDPVFSQHMPGDTVVLSHVYEGDVESASVIIRSVESDEIIPYEKLITADSSLNITFIMPNDNVIVSVSIK